MTAFMRTSLHVDDPTVQVKTAEGAEWVTFGDAEIGQADTSVTLHLPLDLQQALAGAWLNAIAQARDVPIEATVPHRDVHTTTRGERVGVGTTIDGHPAIVAFHGAPVVTLDGDTRRWLRGHLDRLDRDALGWTPPEAGGGS